MASYIIFKQLFDQASATYSYLLAEKASRQAVFIDTVYEQHKRDLSLLRELDLELLACLETHCHADHVTGARRRRQKYKTRAYNQTHIQFLYRPI